MIFLSLLAVANGQTRRTLRGKVTDSQGAVINASSVVLANQDRISQTTSDQEGLYSFTNVSPGKYTVEVSGIGFEKRTIEITIAAEDQLKELPITLAVAGSNDCNKSYGIQRSAGSRKLTVKVISSDAPMAKASLLLTATFPSRSAVVRETDGDGKFVFNELSPGQYELKVSRDGYFDEHVGTFWITRENETTVTVDLLKHGLLRICE
jgi:hypothetical protein